MSPFAPAGNFFVYILRCADGSFYVGHTVNVSARIQTHNEGRGAFWTARRRPVTLVYQESALSEAEAVAREHQIKRWTHNKKLALIKGGLAKLEGLAKRHGRGHQ
jgi:predicted GIY-YIG superfamily endonuclease